MHFTKSILTQKGGVGKTTISFTLVLHGRQYGEQHIGVKYLSQKRVPSRFIASKLTAHRS
jgi:cellulose biosynthesis protein BcsQ